MLDNYPPGMRHEKLNGETKEQAAHLYRIANVHNCINDCVSAVAAIIRNYKHLEGINPDMFYYVADTLGDMLHPCVKNDLKALAEEDIDESTTPPNYKDMGYKAYLYATRRSDDNA